MNAQAESASRRGHSEPSSVRLGGIPLLATVLAEVTAGMVLGNGGVWPAGPGPWLLLLASALTGVAARAAGDARFRFRILAGFTILGVASAAAVAWWAGLWMAVLAGLACWYHSLRDRARLGPALFALCRSGSLGLGLTVGLAGPIHFHAFGLPVVAALYGVLAFSVARIGCATGGDEPEPGERPIDFLATGSWALLTLPLVPLLPASHLLARSLSLASILIGGLGFFQLVRRKRPWDQRAVATATVAGFRSLLLFSAAAVLLPWTFTSIELSVVILAGVALLATLSRLRQAIADRRLPETERPATLNLGIAHLEQAFTPPAATHEPSELTLARRELVQVHARLAQAQRAGANDAARTGLLERRIEKLLDLVQHTEDELRRVSRLKAVDPGQASVYRAVQGLDDVDEQYGLKAELLSAILEANLELRRNSGALGVRESA